MSYTMKINAKTYTFEGLSGVPDSLQDTVKNACVAADVADDKVTISKMDFHVIAKRGSGENHWILTLEVK